MCITALDVHGTLYVADGHRYRRVMSAGRFGRRRTPSSAIRQGIRRAWCRALIRRITQH